jgi:hypothetical protein
MLVQMGQAAWPVLSLSEAHDSLLQQSQPAVLSQALKLGCAEAVSAM